MFRRLLVPCLILSLVLLSFLSSSRKTLAATPSSIQGLHVLGNKIVNGANQPLKLVGVNRSGGEYMCVQDRGIWDGPVDQASINAILSWNVNIVRIPLNEDCWLNINGANASFS